MSGGEGDTRKVSRIARSDSDRLAVRPVCLAPPVTGGQLTSPPASGWVTEPPVPPSGASEQVDGGTGFNDAQPVGDGVWRDDIATGQTVFYRVPVDWGQQLAVTVELGNARTDDEYASVLNAFQVEILSPARAFVQREAASYDGDLNQLQLLTAPAAYDHRFVTDDWRLSQMRFAGWHYITVTLHQDVAELIKDDSIGLHLRVSVEGEPLEGPVYEDPEAAVQAGFGVTDGDREQAEQGLTDDEIAAAARGTKQLVGCIGIGAGLLLLALLGAWMVREKVPEVAAAAPHTDYLRLSIAEQKLRTDDLDSRETLRQRRIQQVLAACAANPRAHRVQFQAGMALKGKHGRRGNR
jgi:hypothetical protein